MAVARAILDAQSKASWIRKMFEEGAALKKIHGADKVFDFSIGNPDVEPPADFHNVLVRLAAENKKGSHGYMPNAGFVDVREALCRKVNREHAVNVSAKDIVMTVGAAGGLNTVLKAILNPGDEVIVPKPFFVEYGSYISNHGGKMILVETSADFDLDIGKIAEALSEKTAAVLINSPHNPTGRIYSKKTIADLSALLVRHGAECGRKPYLVADEPYRDIAFDGKEVAPVLSAYADSIVVTSYSKSLSLSGERIGYIAVNPAGDSVQSLLDALSYATRVLGYVNAPALMQRIVAELIDAKVDVGIYQKRKDVFKSVLDDAGIEYAEPEGAFYLFCKVPGTGNDDVGFVMLLKEHKILAVPGSGFGMPGYFRLAYCLDEKIIEASRAAFKTAVSEYKNI